jgi:hypothetical protein
MTTVLVLMRMLLSRHGSQRAICKGQSYSRVKTTTRSVLLPVGHAIVHDCAFVFTASPMGLPKEPLTGLKHSARQSPRVGSVTAVAVKEEVDTTSDASAVSLEQVITKLGRAEDSHDATVDKR